MHVRSQTTIIAETVYFDNSINVKNWNSGVSNFIRVKGEFLISIDFYSATHIMHQIICVFFFFT